MKNKLAKYKRVEVVDNFFIWYDKDEIVATVRILDIDGGQWVSNLFVSPKYRKQRLSYELLDIATMFGASKLLVRKTNKIAIHAYKKYGFEVFDDNDEFLCMKITEDKYGRTRKVCHKDHRADISNNCRV